MTRPAPSTKTAARLAAEKTRGIPLMFGRRSFLCESGRLASLLAASCLGLAVGSDRARAAASAKEDSPNVLQERTGETGLVTLFLCGDVMTGRGIDQILPHPGDPALQETYVRHALTYVELAETVNGPIERPVDFQYVWGDALAELAVIKPDASVVNLETSVTTSDDYWPRKGIHYRMHPRNVECLTAAGFDCCVLANNHVMDWGYAGLEQTLGVLRDAGLATAGAGPDREQAQQPAVLELPGGGRVLVFALGSTSSGIPTAWAAGDQRPGVNLMTGFSHETARQLAEQVSRVKRDRDMVVASIHWGGNWGYDIPDHHRDFARELIDSAGVDVVHGHSSHHPKGIEVYRDRPIIYGCGDFLNDYEGIEGHAGYRGDLALMYFPTFDSRDGRLASLCLTPMQIKQMRLNRVSDKDFDWLETRLNREGARLGTRIARDEGGRFRLHWD